MQMDHPVGDTWCAAADNGYEQVMTATEVRCRPSSVRPINP
jgi:hypothetical protein